MCCYGCFCSGTQRVGGKNFLCSKKQGINREEGRCRRREGRRLILRSKWMNCSGLCRIISCGRDLVLEKGKNVRSPPSVDKRAAETSGDELITTCIPCTCREIFCRSFGKDHFSWVSGGPVLQSLTSAQCLWHTGSSAASNMTACVGKGFSIPSLRFLSGNRSIYKKPLKNLPSTSSTHNWDTGKIYLTWLKIWKLFFVRKICNSNLKIK